MSKKAIVLFILTFVSMILGFVKESAIVYTLGASWKADVFTFASNLPIILFSSISSVISTTFMPIYTDIRLNESKDEANSFASRFGLIVTAICSIVVILISIFPNVIVKIMAPGLVNIEGINSVTRIVVPSIIFLGITSIVVGALESYNHVEISTARQIPFNLLLLAAMIVIYPMYGLIGSVVVILLAAILQLLFVLMYSKKINLRYKKPTDKTKTFINKSLKMIVPMAIGVMAMQINSIVSTNLASRLGAGSITKINLANKLNMASYSTLGYLIVMLIFPILSQNAAKKDYKKISENLSNGIVKSLIIMTPIFIILFMLSRDIVSFFFQNSKFTKEDVKITANVLRCYLLGLIFWGIKDILNRGYYALKETKISMINGVVTVFINIIFSLILINSYGIVGLAFATSISSVFSVVLLILNLKKINVKLHAKYIISWFFKLVVAALGMCLVYSMLINLPIMHVDGKLQILIKLAGTSAVLITTYLVVLSLVTRNKIYNKLKKNKK